MVIKEVHRVVNFICSIEFLRMSVLWTLNLVISYFRLFGQHVRSHKSSTFPRLPAATLSSGKRPICIITGATSGLGAAAAEALSKEGFFVILVGRSRQLLSKTMIEIRKVNKNVQLEAFEVDLSSFSSIMKFKTSLTQWLMDMNFHPSIQLLINNAGMLATSCRVTNDGHDEMMMTNYIGAFCLTKLLLPLLMNSPIPSRVVNVSSFTHQNADVQVYEKFVSGKLFSNVKQYPFAHLYECSKLCILFFSYELHRQYCQTEASQLSVNVADPGAVKTKIMREIPRCLSLLAFSVLKLLGILQYPEEGVNSILDAALAPPETSGMYFFGGNGRTIKSSPMSYNSILSNRLWETSCYIFLEMKRIYENTSQLRGTPSL